MIKVKHLDKYFNKGKRNEIHVLNDITLDFPEKGLVVLLGPSGSGKTTLLNVIGGLDKVKSGEIDFYDKTIKGYNSLVWDKIRTENVGYIFQNYYLMPEISVYDNVAFVLKMIGITDPKEIETRVEYILRQVNMYPFRKKRASQLSGGQQQRVAIARALVKNPKVIIADEPTGNLDSKNTLEIMNIIKSISSTKLVILVTHEKRLADIYGDRVITLLDGKVVEDKVNDESLNHQIDLDNTIYLKDLNQLSSIDDDHVKVSYYTDSEDTIPLNVKFIIRNKTLYLDLGEFSNKVRVIDSNSNIIVKDAHFKAKTKQEMLETSFDLSILEHEHVKKSHSRTVSLKNSFWIAFKRLLSFGRKGRLMLFIFMISGIIIAASTFQLFSTLFRSYEDKLQIDEDYVLVNPNEFSSFNQLKSSLTGLDYYLYFSEFSQMVTFTSNDYSYPSYGYVRYEYAAELEQSDIIYGRLPQDPYDVVISKGFYEGNDLFTISLTPIGIWSTEGLLNETITFGFGMATRNFKIVGVSDHKRPSVFFGSRFDLLEAVMMGVSHSGQNEDFYYQSFFVANSNDFGIYAKNTQDLKNKLNIAGIDYKTEKDRAINEINREQTLGYTQIITQTLVGLAISMVGFYFIMRSSMISRIYEIAVYRALGVRKSELLLSFSMEIILITSCTSLIGYLIATNFYAQLAESPLGILFKNQVNPLTFLLGLVILYGIHLIVGLLPMINLLRKTPATIFTLYDM